VDLQISSFLNFILKKAVKLLYRIQIRTHFITRFSKSFQNQMRGIRPMGDFENTVPITDAMRDNFRRVLPINNKILRGGQNQEVFSEENGIVPLFHASSFQTIFQK